MWLARLAAVAVALAPAAGMAQAPVLTCDEAWAAYHAFKARTVMEESQYPLTVEGAAVRAACGAQALPAPAGADVVPVRPHVRKPPPKPPAPPPPPVPKPQPVPKPPA